MAVTIAGAGTESLPGVASAYQTTGPRLGRGIENINRLSGFAAWLAVALADWTARLPSFGHSEVKAGNTDGGDGQDGQRLHACTAGNNEKWFVGRWRRPNLGHALSG
jgi:hypothetical protein